MDFLFIYFFAARTPVITSSQIEATKEWDRTAVLPVVGVGLFTGGRQ